MILATLYLPNLNPIGPPSINAAILSLVLILLSSDRLSRLPLSPKRIIVGVTPWLLLLLLSRTEGGPFDWGRSFPDAEDRAADVICLVVGFAFALESFKLKPLLYRLNGIFCTFLFGSVLIYHMVLIHNRSANGLRLALAMILVFWMAWFPVVLRINRRAKRRLFKTEGFCEECGYNLTGNQSGICPECGRKLCEMELGDIGRGNGATKA